MFGERKRGIPRSFSAPDASDEMELEPMIDNGREHNSFSGGADAASVNQTMSGNMLHCRSLSSRTTVASASPSRTTSNDSLHCRSRGGTTTAARAQQAFSRHKRVSCWLVSMLCMVALSIFMNLFEGSYLENTFGRVEQKKPLEGAPIDTQNGTMEPTPTPTLSPITPMLSVHEHITIQYNSTRNTFTSWLDFDERDPAKRNKFPPPGKPETFTDTWCDLRNTEWYPKDWHSRAPSFLLPGAQYSGTVFMAAALHLHPSVLPARTKELKFFHERPFQRYVSRSGQTLVHAARARMHARDFDSKLLENNSTLVQFDASPGYLFFSSLLPRRILCVEPWVKLVVLLRNPVDRVLEHYAAMTKLGLALTLEEWIDQELEVMRSVGLNETVEAESKEEDLAWHEYQGVSLTGALGHSMYAIQIRHWAQAFRAAGRNPKDEILIVRTDHLAIDPALEYDRVVRFVKLPPHELQITSLPTPITHQTRPVSTETRQLLEDLYAPYNRRLKSVLRQYGISSSAEDDTVWMR